MDKLNTSLVFLLFDVFRLGLIFAEVAEGDSSRPRGASNGAEVFSREDLSAPPQRSARTTGLTCSPQTIQ